MPSRSRSRSPTRRSTSSNRNRNRNRNSNRSSNRNHSNRNYVTNAEDPITFDRIPRRHAVRLYDGWVDARALQRWLDTRPANQRTTNMFRRPLTSQQRREIFDRSLHISVRRKVQRFVRMLQRVSLGDPRSRTIRDGSWELRHGYNVGPDVFTFRHRGHRVVVFDLYQGVMNIYWHQYDDNTRPLRLAIHAVLGRFIRRLNQHDRHSTDDYTFTSNDNSDNSDNR